MGCTGFRFYLGSTGSGLIGLGLLHDFEGVFGEACPAGFARTAYIPC